MLLWHFHRHILFSAVCNRCMFSLNSIIFFHLTSTDFMSHCIFTQTASYVFTWKHISLCSNSLSRKVWIRIWLLHKHLITDQNGPSNPQILGGSLWSPAPLCSSKSGIVTLKFTYTVCIIVIAYCCSTSDCYVNCDLNWGNVYPSLVARMKD